MKNASWKKSILCTALLAVMLCALPALAERDTFGLGDGHSGRLVLSTGTTGTPFVANKYAEITALSADAKIISVDTTAGFAAGDLVMVHQTTGFTDASPGDSSDIDLDKVTSSVGQWEFARLSGVSATQLTLDSPLVNKYVIPGAQVIKVPEYTDVRVDSGAVLTADAWNGKKGGIIAFLATGDVVVGGGINASGKGFQGGKYVKDTDPTRKNCSGDTFEQPGGGQRGEGIALSKYGPGSTGRGNVANGAGGGVCFLAGGAGGSNAGRGGDGGKSHNSSDGGRTVGGKGGSKLIVDATTRLLFGGGGGAGHGIIDGSARGGNGGGIILIRAKSLDGGGTIEAKGDAGMNTTEASGAHGGGGGGSAYLRFADLANCHVPVQGGRGGGTDATSYYVGPGGGGGGGRAILQSATGSCNVLFAGANSGQTATPPPGGDSNYGATTGSEGSLQKIPEGFPVSLAVPTVVQPADRSSTNNTLPSFTGTYAPTFPTGTEIVLTISDGTKTLTYSFPAASNWSFTPPVPLAAGTYTVNAAATVTGVWSEQSNTNMFTVDLTPPAPPEVKMPTDGARTNDTTPTYTGTAEPGSTVTVIVDGNPVGTTTTDASGNWIFTQPTELVEKSHTVSATAADVAGNTSANSNTNTFTVDATPPTVAVQTPAEGSRTSDTTPTYSGTVSDDGPGPLTVMIRVDDGPAVAATVTGNTWSYTPTTPLAPGAHSVMATAADDLGNSASDSNTFTVEADNTAPDTTIVSGPEGNTHSQSATFDFNSDEPEVTYECSLDGGAFTACTGPATFEDLAEGEHTLQVRARDSAGNVDSTPDSRIWNYRRPDPDFLGGGISCAASGGTPSTVSMMGLAVLSALLARRRQR
uniref:Bacterial Ig-like domain-containing protein n=1 Tax=Vitiosangium cumulatum TaxID=1867796 RepID=A0A7D4XGT0_9BACT|nr:hypothetical protein [Vitiosangium cumulatum]QKW93749.1 hypothetical protein [Vitiosangium cumulatum]